MEVKVEVKVEVKMDNTVDNQAFVLFDVSPLDFLSVLLRFSLIEAVKNQSYIIIELLH